MKTFGLDLGPTSVGFSVVDKSSKQIIKIGSHTFEAGMSFAKGQSSSNGAERRVLRQARIGNARKRLTKRELIKQLLLDGRGMFPTVPINDRKAFNNEINALVLPKHLKDFFALNPYKLRKEALERPLTSFEMGRILYHLAQRKGFRGSLQTGNEKEEGAIYEGAAELGMLGINDTNKLIQEKGSTLGVALESLLPRENEPFKQEFRRARARYTHRDMYVEEFNAIWDYQKANNPVLAPILTDVFRKKIGPPENHLEEGGAVFHQRRLRPQARYNCSLEPKHVRCYDSEPIFEEYRMLKFINSIKYEEGRVVNNKEIDLQPAFELFNTIPSKTSYFLFEDLRKAIGLSHSKCNYDDKLKVQYNRTSAQLRKILTPKVWDNAPLYWDETKGKKPTSIGFTKQDWWHLIKFTDSREWLEGYLRMNYKTLGIAPKNIDAEKNNPIKQISGIKMTKSSGSLSRKAMLNILPYLQKGYQEHDAMLFGGVKNCLAQNNLWNDKATDVIEKNLFEDELWKAIKKESDIIIIERIKNFLHGKFIALPKELLGLYHHSDKASTQEVPLLEELPPAPSTITNPVVRRTLGELRLVVNALIKEYGHPEMIKVEMARDLKANSAKREKMYDEQRLNESLNEEARFFLRENKYAETDGYSGNVMRYRLWQELGGQGKARCPYSNIMIDPFELFSKNSPYEVEHIIPESISHNNKQSNLTLCHKTKNSQKKNRTPFQAFGETSEWNLMIEYSKILPYNKRNLFLNDKTPEPMANQERLMNDTHYIARAAREYLKHVCEKVETTTGGVTAILRAHWGFSSLVERSLKVDKPDGQYILAYIEERDTDNENESDTLSPKKKMKAVVKACELCEYDAKKEDEMIKKWKKDFKVKKAKPKKGEPLSDDEADDTTSPLKIVTGTIKDGKFRPEKNRDDNRHHAIDAAVVALSDASYISAIGKLSETGKKMKELKDDALYTASLPWENVRTQMTSLLHRMVVTRDIKDRSVQPADKKVTKWKYKLEGGKLKRIKETFENKSAKTLKVREELHKSTYYGKYIHCTDSNGKKYVRKWQKDWEKDPFFTGMKTEEKYHINTHLNDINNIKDIESIVNQEIKKLILDRLDATACMNVDGEIEKKISLSGIRTKQQLHEEFQHSYLIEKAESFLKAIEEIEDPSVDYTFKYEKSFPTEVFFRYDTTLNLNVPQVYLPNRNGDNVPVIRVRCTKPMGNARKLRSDDSNTWVDPKNNNHVIIYRDEIGEQKAKIIQLMETVERARQGLDQIDKKVDGQYMYYLRKGHYVLKEYDASMIDWNNPPSLESLSPHLYMLRKLSGTEDKKGNEKVRLDFMHHVSSHLNPDDAQPPHVWRASAHLINALPVEVSKDGKISQRKDL